MKQGTPANRRRCVTFVENDEQQHSYYSYEQQQDASASTWETPHERYMRQSRIQRDINDYKQGRRMSDNKTFSTLGLLDKIASSERKLQQDIARNTLHELVECFNQFHQQSQSHKEHDEEKKEEDDFSDSENEEDESMLLALASMCETATYESRKRAYQSAVGLQHEIQQYLLQ